MTVLEALKKKSEAYVTRGRGSKYCPVRSSQSGDTSTYLGNVARRTEGEKCTKDLRV